MAIKLKKGNLVLKIEKAGEKYRGSRFDWNGLVSSVKFQGIQVLGQEKPLFQRNARIFGRGLHNEFGIIRPLGYDECQSGQWFPKIGTGWLKRDDKPYSFFTQYPVEPVTTTFEKTDDSRVVFTSNSGVRNGWGWHYTKEIEVKENSFVIRYSLENIGSKVLETDEYVHNFLCINNQKIDSSYVLEFPFPLDTSRCKEVVDPEDLLSVSGNSVQLTKIASKQYYLGGLSEGVTEKEGLAAQWTLTERKTGISITETGSFKPSGMHVWGWKKVISPEVFFSFHIEPGNVMTWERIYGVSRV